MTTTRTGSFPIGFRLGPSPWQKDLGQAIDFAKRQGFAGLDLPQHATEPVKQVLDAGLTVGSVDLPQPWDDLAAADAGKRRDAADRMAASVKAIAALGVRNFFVVMLPEDDQRPRSENLDFAVDGYRRLCEQIEPSGARIVLEGWPGPPPHLPALGCTPADLRLIFARVGSQAIGVNFDPSHLIRMGIDAVRFAEEFAPRIYHAHAKDTELIDEGRYDYGTLQPASVEPPHAYGGHAWRYTIPGHGVGRWTRMLDVLATAGYDGMISIELEDENFHGSEADEQRGLLASLDFLRSA